MTSKFLIFLLLLVYIGSSETLDANNYTKFIEELSQDEKFLNEYAKWSFELFSQPDYLYGTGHNSFPCPITQSSNTPTSVHALRPGDIKCVGAMGDSLTAGLGAEAITPIGLLFENRGISWSVGGDYKYSKVVSIPNILRQYNPKLEGFSTKTSVIFLNGQNATNNRLNVAKSGDRSDHMPDQAELLMNRLKTEKLCDWENDWKVITFFVGGNDLCSFCEDPNVTKHTPEQYASYVRDTLDKLYNAHMPRTFVNLVLVLDVRGVKDLNSGGYVCQLLHKRTCPCAAFPTNEQAKILDDYIPRYHQVLLDLVDSGRYDQRDDFTVVVQPFMAKTKIPLKSDQKVDFSYFAPDCFHFSGKGHSQAALSLWNNMLEPVGAKQWYWHINEELKCPSATYPFLFTNKNSAEALSAYKRSTTDRTSKSSSTNTSEKPNDTTKRNKHHRSNPEKSFSTLKIVTLTTFILIVMILFILSITRRERILNYAYGIRRRGIVRFRDTNGDDDDDVEVWSRPYENKASLQNPALPKTHGTRVLLE